MKYFIASDIHGSAAWCRKMLEAFEKEQADRLILLGDVLYHARGTETAILNKYVICLDVHFANCPDGIKMHQSADHHKRLLLWEQLMDVYAAKKCLIRVLIVSCHISDFQYSK